MRMVSRRWFGTIVVSFIDRSVSSSDLQLGEVRHSYGYGGTGKISEDCKFKNYGKKFGQGDVIGCYLDMNCDPIIIKYTINGQEQGVAFKINKSELEGKALFPHVLTKNQDFTVNFGQMPGPLFPLIKGRKALFFLQKISYWI